MKWSKYNLLFNSKKHGFLLFNSLTDSFLSLSLDTYNFIINNKKSVENLLDSEIGDTLVKCKCIVNSDIDELNEIQYLSLLSKTNRNELHLTIAPTYDCNFDCSYCYEKERRSVYMDKQIQDKLIDFVKSFTKINKVNITWYGGEPLMDISIIESLIHKLNKLELKVNNLIVTNGYNLNIQNIFKLKSLNILSAQITIDGIKEIHDQRRYLIGGGNTFDRIIENVDLLLNTIPDFVVNFRVNVDKKNSTSFYSIFTFLAKRYKGKKVFIHPGFVDEIVDTCSSVSNCNFNRKDKVEFKKELFMQYGLNLGIFPDSQRKPCIARILNGYVIGADGYIFKCWNDIGITDKAISHLNNPKINHRTLYFRYLNAADNFNDEKCKECILLPSCDGGCQYLRLKNKYENGRFDTCHIAKNNIQELLELHYDSKQENYE